MRAEIDGMVYNLQEVQLPIAGLQDAGPIGIGEFAKAIHEAAKQVVNDLHSGFSKQDLIGLTDG